MATARTIILAIILLAPSMALAQSGTAPIQALAPLPHTLWAASAVWDGSGVVVFGGLTASGPTDEILRYDPSSDAWTTMRSKLPAPAAYTSAVWTGSEALVFGVNDLVVRYDPAHDALNTMDAHLPTARTHAGAVWSGVAAYVFGGQSATGIGLREILRVVPGAGTSGTVTKLSATLDITVNETTAVWAGKYALVFGSSAPSTDPGTAWSYDPSTQIVRAANFIGNSRGFGPAAVFDGTDAYVFGGQSRLGYYESPLRWDFPDGGARLNDAPFGSARGDIAVAWDGSSAYLVGGTGDRGASDALVRYTPSLTTGGAQPKAVASEGNASPSSPTPATTTAPSIPIQTLRPMPTQLSGAAAVTDGSTIFVFGGDTPNGPTDAILRYDVASDTWTRESARLPAAISNATAVWTGSRAIIAGGNDGIVSFDPAAHTANTVAHLPSARKGAASVYDGSFMWIIGGDAGAGRTSDIFKFDPATADLQTMPAQLIHPVAYPAYAWTGDRAIIAGGQDPLPVSQDRMVGIAFDPRSVSSRETGGFQGSDGMGAAYFDGIFYEIGGIYGRFHAYDNGIGRVEVDFGGSPVPNTKLDPGRAFAAVVRVGPSMIVMGGETQNGKIDSVAKLTPSLFPGYVPPAQATPTPSTPQPTAPSLLPDHETRMPRDVTWFTNHWQIDGNANGCALQTSDDGNHILTALLQDFDGTISGKDPSTGATLTKTAHWSLVVTQLSSNMQNGCNGGRIVSDGQRNDELGYLVAMNLSWSPVITPDHNVFALTLGPGSTNSASGTASACAQIGGGQGTVAITGFSGDVVGRNATSPTMDFNAIPGTSATSTTRGSFDLILARPATYGQCDTSGISMSGTSFGTLVGLRFAGAAAPPGISSGGSPTPSNPPPTARTPCYDLLSCPIGDISSLRARISSVHGQVLTVAGLAIAGAPILLLGQQQNALKLISVTQTASDGSFNVPISAIPPAYAATVLGGHVVMQDLTQVPGGVPSTGALDIKLPVSAAAAAAQTGTLTSAQLDQLKTAFQDAKPYGVPSVSAAQPAAIDTSGYAGISRVTVATQAPQQDARLMVVALNGKGSDKIPDPPEGKPERYFALQLTDTQGNELPLQSMTISFAAPADAAGKDVTLQHFRLDTQRWESLPTRDGGNGTYLADVDSLSLFAVSTSQPTALAALLSSALGSRWTLPVVGGVIVLGIAVAVVSRARATRTGRAAPKPGAAAAVGLRAQPLPDREALIADLSVSAKSTKILQNVSFSFGQGEILALLGPSGSGKSTLLKALLGEISFSGEVSLFGIDPARRDPSMKKLIGYVSQETELYPDMTLRENVEYFGKQYGLGAKDLKDRVGPLLETLGLTERAETRVGLLSGGQQRRASIAATLVHAPSLLILDEPTSGLDPVTRKSLWKFVRQASRELGVTVIVTTHFLDEADLADRVVILNKGAVVKAGTPAELVRSLPGGGRAVVVELQSSSPAIEARVRDAVRPLTERGTIAAVDLSGYTARFFTANAQAASRDLLDAFGHADVPVKQVTTEECGMDAVFTYYAGERWKETDDA